MPILKTARETEQPAAQGRAPKRLALSSPGASPERLRELLLEALAAIDTKRVPTAGRTNPEDDDEDPTRRGGLLP